MTGAANFWDGFEDAEGTINEQHPVFQLGRYLFEAQVLHADAEAAETGKTSEHTQPVTPERVKQLCRRYCQLVNAVGLLRASHERLRERQETLWHKVKQLFKRTE